MEEAKPEEVPEEMEDTSDLPELIQVQPNIRYAMHSFSYDFSHFITLCVTGAGLFIFGKLWHSHVTLGHSIYQESQLSNHSSQETDSTEDSQDSRHIQQPPVVLAPSHGAVYITKPNENVTLRLKWNAVIPPFLPEVSIQRLDDPLKKYTAHPTIEGSILSLPEGHYQWSLRIVDEQEQTSPWSKAREFWITDRTHRMQAKTVRSFASIAAIPNNSSHHLTQITQTSVQPHAPTTSPPHPLPKAHSRPPKELPLVEPLEEKWAKEWRKQKHLPQSLHLVSPEYGEVLSLSSVAHFSWKSSSFHQKYEVQISDDAQFKMHVQTVQTSKTDVYSLIKKPGRYFWRVRSFQNLGDEPSAWSYVQIFSKN